LRPASVDVRMRERATRVAAEEAAAGEAAAGVTHSAFLRLHASIVDLDLRPPQLDRRQGRRVLLYLRLHKGHLNARALLRNFPCDNCRKSKARAGAKTCVAAAELSDWLHSWRTAAWEGRHGVSSRVNKSLFPFRPPQGVEEGSGVGNQKASGSSAVRAGAASLCPNHANPKPVANPTNTNPKPAVPKRHRLAIAQSLRGILESCPGFRA